MVEEVAAQLGEYAHDQVDNALRTLAIVYEGDCEVVYLRNDLKGEYSASDYKSVVDTFRHVPELDQTTTRDVPLGDKNCLIHYHEKAFVFQFPHEGCHSILLSVDPSVGSRLQSFIEGCQERL